MTAASPETYDDGADELEDLADLGDDELELLLHWITNGPPRPPESADELVGWARERGLVPGDAA